MSYTIKIVGLNIVTSAIAMGFDWALAPSILLGLGATLVLLAAEFERRDL